MLGSNKSREKNKEDVIAMGEKVLFQSGKISLKRQNMSLPGKEHYREKTASPKALRKTTTLCSRNGKANMVRTN